AEVPLAACVARQRLAVACGLLSLLLPFILLLLKQFRLDFESQREDGFGLYAQFADWLLHAVSPELLGFVLLAATGALYLWFRPRRRDVFWDVAPAGTSQTSKTEDSQPLELHAAPPVLAALPRSELITRAEKYFAEGNY